jgi:hypothetical protein
MGQGSSTKWGPLESLVKMDEVSPGLAECFLVYIFTVGFPQHPANTRPTGISSLLPTNWYSSPRIRFLCTLYRFTQLGSSHIGSSRLLVCIAREHPGFGILGEYHPADTASCREDLCASNTGETQLLLPFFSTVLYCTADV